MSKEIPYIIRYSGPLENKVEDRKDEKHTNGSHVVCIVSFIMSNADWLHPSKMHPYNPSRNAVFLHRQTSSL